MNEDSQCSNSTVSILPHFNNTCANENYICDNFDVTKSYRHTEVLRTTAWINWCLTFGLTFMSVINIYHIWIKEKSRIEGWPWRKVIYGINVSRFKCFPKWLVGFGLICKLVPSLSMDVIDILTDTLYFHQIIQQCGVLDPRLHTPLFVFHTLFAFMVMGMAKNLVINSIANRQLTKRLQVDDFAESELIDRNAYMAITFFQGVLSFVFQDAVAAIIQYFYIDKYTIEVNMIATFNGVIMLVFSIRVCYVFIRYMYQYWDHDDSLNVKALHSIMLGTKLSVSLFHAMRMYAVVFSKIFGKFNEVDKELDASCFHTTTVDNVKTTTQSPFSWDCMGLLDKSLIAFTIFASVGVLICTVIVCSTGLETFKIFNQSHYSGRIGAISGIDRGTKSIATNRMGTMSRPRGFSGVLRGLSPRAYDASISRATELEYPAIMK